MFAVDVFDAEAVVGEDGVVGELQVFPDGAVFLPFDDEDFSARLLQGGDG